jgi:hypothetical protein
VKQLITISKDGTLTGLQMKKGKGVDLRKLGSASIVRSSLIEWRESHQAWFVKFLNGELSYKEITSTLSDNLGLSLSPDSQFGEGVLLWEDYDDAVKAEIEVIQAIRLKHGVSYV